MSITVENLTYTYSKGMPNETRALEDVSFRLVPGEFAAIIGHTGSGKSTLVQQLNGLLRPDSGKITVGEVCITDPSTKMTEVRRKVGLVFQYPEYQLFEETVAKDVAFGPKQVGITGEELDRVVEESIRLTGLDYEEVKERSPFELSGGQKRRVAIAGVLAMKPEILILDEPTAGLDPSAHRDVLELILRIHRKDPRPGGGVGVGGSGAGDEPGKAGDERNAGRGVFSRRTALGDGSGAAPGHGIYGAAKGPDAGNRCGTVEY